MSPDKSSVDVDPFSGLFDDLVNSAEYPIADHGSSSASASSFPLDQPPPESNKSSRIKPSRRAEHNATERARRESLNSKFRLLSSTLPNLRTCRKPSKSQIIEKAIEWVEQSLYTEEQHIAHIRRLQEENRRMAECLGSAYPSPPQIPSSVAFHPAHQQQQQPPATRHQHPLLLAPPPSSAQLYAPPSSSMYARMMHHDLGSVTRRRSTGWQ
ncbi:hypothetical protein BCR43DRAFT_517896 [Syncephalastrum racemosum]|uniref:BHLH domain-containing protein n=1 Tax=Syncephalastrum racemosum TaxID=13706 RepID=A0A1X2H236_SYNRA|nr:hypothetical protein BCR43DRAFT_517896 [Syncephalastrum racemosum]